jgi:hypothetical protein
MLKVNVTTLLKDKYRYVVEVKFDWLIPTENLERRYHNTNLLSVRAGAWRK